MSKSYEILKAIAKKCAAGESITLAPDYGLGSATLILQDGSHTHFGADVEDDEKKAVDDFVDGLHAILVGNGGLSLAPPSVCTCRNEPMAGGGIRLVQCPKCAAKR